MELPIEKKQSGEFWKAHVDAWTVTKGSMAAYCKEHGLTKSQFSYYRQKFATRKSKFAEVKTIDVQPPMSLVPRDQAVGRQKLPDPAWLAVLIKELAR